MTILRANASFSAGDPQGRRHFVQEGTLVDSADLVVKGREHLFDPAEARVVSVFGTRAAPVVEQATAAPGEKRAVAKVAKKA